MSNADAVEQALLQVSVTVNNLGQAVCSPDPVVVTGTDVQIGFVLNSNAWVFPDTNAVVVGGGSNAQFPLPASTQNSQLVTLLDRDTVKGSYPYTVTLRHAATGRLVHIDPTIRNET